MELYLIVLIFYFLRSDLLAHLIFTDSFRSNWYLPFIFMPFFFLFIAGKDLNWSEIIDLKNIHMKSKISVAGVLAQLTTIVGPEASIKHLDMNSG